MAGGLRFDSLADMPEGMRRLAAKKVVEMVKEPMMGTISTTEEPPKENKYHNVEVDHKGIHFKSRKEARRYDYLMYCLGEGFIKDLKLQEEFTLQAAFTKPDGERVRAIRYMADFSYTVVSCPMDPTLRISEDDREYWRQLYPGDKVVEDVKSQPTRTKTYIIKKKLMVDRFGITIREV